MALVHQENAGLLFLQLVLIWAPPIWALVDMARQSDERWRAAGLSRVRWTVAVIFLAALGALLYEILTGRPPHVGQTTMEIYGKIVRHDPVPPRKLNPKAPPELETIALKAMEKSPADRYATAQELADDLARYLENKPIRARRGLPPIKAHASSRRLTRTGSPPVPLRAGVAQG